jgi:hypothetical protein
MEKRMAVASALRAALGCVAVAQYDRVALPPIDFKLDREKAGFHFFAPC